MKGGRVRDLDKLEQYDRCIIYNNKFTCLKPSVVDSTTTANKFFVIVDFSPDSDVEFYKDQYVNVLLNYNVSLNNIFIITRTELSNVFAVLFKESLVLKGDMSADQIIDWVREFINESIVKKIVAENLVGVSVIIELAGSGLNSFDRSEKIVDLLGNQDGLIDSHQFVSMFDGLYKNNAVTDVTFITNTNYSGIKFNGVFLDWLRNKGILIPNTNIFTGTPFLIYIYMLILYLETNPINHTTLNTPECIKYLQNDLVAMGLTKHIGLIDKFRVIMQQWKAPLDSLIALQQVNPFSGDWSDLDVVSNNLLMIFRQINHESSMLLFSKDIQGPFKELDNLSNLDITLREFNLKLGNYYRQLVRNTFNTIQQSEQIKILKTHKLRYNDTPENANFINELVKLSLEEVPDCFLISVNGTTRFGSTNEIRLSEIF